ncbi:MAG: 2-hydroxyacyl-CoA dehydratase [bacterium]|nr:2-hydroxyacyl-CoA dehydratase [bacterium]
MKIMDTIQHWSSVLYNEHLKEAKESGKQIIGYYCSYIPEEIIAAAGLIPFRMRGTGSEGTELADTYYSPTNCLYPRNVLNLAMKGEYDFLDGMIFMNSCDHTRRLYDIWKKALPPKESFLYFLDVPHKMDELYVQRYTDILKKFITHLETTYNCTITDEALLESIKLYNRRKTLIRSLYEKRSGPNPTLSGSEYLRVLLAVTALPVEKAIEVLSAINNADNPSQKTISPDSVRVVLTGGCMEEPDHLSLIEDSGVHIAEDNTCLGWRFVDGDIRETGDPLYNIAHRYLNHLSCPRMGQDHERRLSFVSDLYTKNNVDAVIVEKMPFCILYSGEVHLFREEAKKHNYPLLVLERGYADKSTGQLKTRVQAFVETVGNNKQSLQNHPPL